MRKSRSLKLEDQVLFVWFCFFSEFSFLKKIIILEKEHEWWGNGAEGKRESQADSVLSVEPNTRLNLMTLRS